MGKLSAEDEIDHKRLNGDVYWMKRFLASLEMTFIL